jgi:hypothetical protein
MHPGIRSMREALALPVATFSCSAMAACLLATLAWGIGPHAPLIRGDFGVMVFLAFAVCLPYVVIVGLPVGLFLVHKRMFRAIPALVAGAVAASPIPLLIVASTFSGPISYEGIGFSVAFILFAALSGAISGLVFYWTHRLMSPGGPGSRHNGQMAK